MVGFYMDDSADAQRKTVFSVAGLLARPGDWFEVQRHWERRLKREGLEYFRTYDCINLEGEFQTKLVDRRGLTTARVIADALLVDVKHLTSASPLCVFCLGILMDDYRKVCAEADGAIVLNQDPYVFAHQQLIGNVLSRMYESPGKKHTIAFLYDEHSKATLLKNSWLAFQNANPNWAQFAGCLEPLDDKVHIPIQMADLVAHSTTRMFQDESKETGLEKLKQTFGKALCSVAYVDETYLRAMVAQNIESARASGAIGGLINKAST